MGLLVRVQLRAPSFLCVAQLVESSVWSREVAGSSPAAQTRFDDK